MQEALRRGIPVVTSNKWPVALRGAELAELARRRGVAFRIESTVMSGTPLLSALVEGLAGAVPVGPRGLLNATANFILTRTAQGRPTRTRSRRRSTRALPSVTRLPTSRATTPWRR
jgi:homoserine dehydrogenase